MYHALSGVFSLAVCFGDPPLITSSDEVSIETFVSQETSISSFGTWGNCEECCCYGLEIQNRGSWYLISLFKYPYYSSIVQL